MRKVLVSVLCLCILFSTIFATTTQGATQESEISPYLRYLVQVGAYETDEKADEMYEDMRQRGYEPLRIEYSDYTRIFAGIFENCKEAEYLVKELGYKDIYSFIRTDDIRQIADQIGYEIPSEEVQTDETIVKNINLSSDTTITGVFGGYTFYFYKNDRWEFTNNIYFELQFSRSQIEAENSTITIYCNDKPVNSFLIQSDEVIESIRRVKIPLEYIEDGYNKIEIKSYNRLSEFICEDDLNPANWLMIHKESFIHLEFEKDDKPYYLSEYPEPYLDNSYEEVVKTKILVSDNFRKCDLKTALSISADFGRRFKTEDLDIDIEKISEAKRKDETNLIYIGGPENAPESILNLLSEDEKDILDTSVFLKQVRSPYNEEHKMLIILSKNEESLVKAASLLSDDDLLCQVRSNTQKIDSDLELVEKNIEKVEEDGITLEEMGYSGNLLEGLFKNEISYGFDIPNDWQIKPGSKLVLKTRYSEALNFEKSAVTVYINNIPIGSRLLTKENADDDTLEFNIPEEFSEQMYYDIRISYFLNVSNVDCEKRTTNFAWAYISKDSYLEIEHDIREKNYLEHYVSPFVENKQFNDLVFVMPHEVNNYEMNFLGEIVSYIGHSLEKTTGFELIYEDEFSEEYEDKNIIVYGTLNDNSLIKDINDDLWIQLDEEGKSFLSNDEITLLDDYRYNLASIQIIKSPYNENRTIMVLTATEREKLKLILNYLSDEEDRNKLFGNAVLIDDYGKIMNNYYGETAEEFVEDKEDTDLIPETEDENTKNPNLKYYIIFFVFTVIIIVLALVLMFFKKKKSGNLTEV